ncbi:MFS transporter [Roseofilum sp. Belize Diploria]|uniref:MFS transporter n=1 Tax=Roseofilum sp. Belize Diploria TaxID=2821501 RepID=UPI001B1B9B56|nr:MFS transporter [Roseofilum sp. Belize Diploria]MBP0010399.1 MFS transporter [Roseofilum sp. Belize Diploria]
MNKDRVFSVLPQLPQPVWMLAAGRLLSQIGIGFTLFYAPIFFVNQVGLSATQVGLGLGCSAFSGILGRFLGGNFTDSPQWGRRRTLLLSALVSAFADVILALIVDFPTLVVGNLLMGLGIGLYWPATETVVADVTRIDQRNEAFALARLADNLGLGCGVLLGGILIEAGLNFRWLFVMDGVSFLGFFALIYTAIEETQPQNQKQQPQNSSNWGVALGDRQLQKFVIVNLLFTTYLSQQQSTLPLYLSNFLASGGFSPAIISSLFTGQIAFLALCQLPIARSLNRWSRSQSLMVSLSVWSASFVLVWIVGGVHQEALFWAISALIAMAVATAIYTPSASALVVDLAPEDLRGTYLAINAQCWAIGYLIGPSLGGWVLDQSRIIIDGFWLAIAFSPLLGIWILRSVGNGE